MGPVSSPDLAAKREAREGAMLSHHLHPHDEHAGLDLIRTSIPEDAPDWTENLCWMMNDPKTGVSIYAHVGRMQPDRRIWEGLSLIYLPDGTRLVNRSLGVSPAAARNGEYDFRPVVPTRLWRYDFEGVAQRVDAESLRTRPVGDEPFEAASYELSFEALQPVFNMHQSRLPSDRMHLDQGGRFQGVVVAGGRSYQIDCAGYRDHSASRRTFVTLDSETWANAVFPSGRIFSLLQVSRQEINIREGQIFVDGEMHVAKPLNVAELKDAAGSPHQGSLLFEAGGKTHEIAWRTSPDESLPFQLLRPVGLRPGINTEDQDGLFAVQCPCEFVWDGETGHGWMERVRPIRVLGG